jgi:hypothetical protein
MLQTSPEPDPVIDDLSRQILCRLSKHDNFYVGMAVISRLRDLVDDLPASANHHHSEPYGLLRHSLEVSLKMLVDFKNAAAESGSDDKDDSSTGMFRPVWQFVCFLAGLCHDLGKLMEMDVHDMERHRCPFKKDVSQVLPQCQIGTHLQVAQRPGAWPSCFVLAAGHTSSTGPRRP